MGAIVLSKIQAESGVLRKVAGRTAARRSLFREIMRPREAHCVFTTV